jgi:hypothetical protein
MQRALSSVPRWTAWHAPGSLAHAAESYAAAVAGLSSNGSGSDGAAGSANSRWVPLAAGKSSSEWITAIQQFYGGFDYTVLRLLPRRSSRRWQQQQQQPDPAGPAPS